MLSQARLTAAVVILGEDAFIKQFVPRFVKLDFQKRDVVEHRQHNFALLVWYCVLRDALKVAHLAFDTRLHGSGLALRLTFANFARNLRTIA